jgi:hypothetical protein
MVMMVVVVRVRVLVMHGFVRVFVGFVLVRMVLAVLVAVFVLVGVFVLMRVVRRVMRLVGCGGEFDVQVDAADALAQDAGGGELKLTGHGQVSQGVDEGVQVHAQVQGGAQEHVAGDAVEGVDVQVVWHGWWMISGQGEEDCGQGPHWADG